MTDLNAMEILSHKEFWAKDPAPGTVFFELGASGLVLVGIELDPEVDEPSNAVMMQVGSKRDPKADELYAVLKWGSWDTPENQKIYDLREKTRQLVAEEEAQLAAEEQAS